MSDIVRFADDHELHHRRWQNNESECDSAYAVACILPLFTLIRFAEEYTNMYIRRCNLLKWAVSAVTHSLLLLTIMFLVGVYDLSLQIALITLVVCIFIMNMFTEIMRSRAVINDGGEKMTDVDVKVSKKVKSMSRGYAVLLWCIAFVPVVIVSLAISMYFFSAWMFLSHELQAAVIIMFGLELARFVLLGMQVCVHEWTRPYSRAEFGYTIILVLVLVIVGALCFTDIKKLA